MLVRAAGFEPATYTTGRSGTIIAASAKLLVERPVLSADEVAGRVAFAALVEVPELLPDSLMILLVETQSIFDHTRFPPARSTTRVPTNAALRH